MAQKFRVVERASVHVPAGVVGVHEALIKGPCFLPNNVVEYLSSKKAGRSGKTILEDHIKNGYIEPDGAYTHIDADRIEAGVHAGETPPLRADPSKDNKQSTPNSLLVQDGGSGISSRSTPAGSPADQGGIQQIPGQPQNLGQVPADLTFNLTDEQLEGKDIDELNAMIIERIPQDERASFNLYHDIAEAKAHLRGELQE